MTHEKHLTDAHYTALRDYVSRGADPVLLTVELLLRTGMRQDELVRLTRDSFNPDRARVRIQAAKGSRNRTLPLPAETVARLRPLLEQLGDRPWGCLLSPVALNKPAQTRMVRNRVRQVMSDALGIPMPALPYSTHSLRHTFALRFLRACGNDLLQTQLAMGHVSISNTARYLQYLQSEDIAETVLKAIG